MEIMQKIRDSIVVKVLVLGVMMLLLLIPLYMVKSVIKERKARRDNAVREVQQKWGESQTVIGPILVLPYQEVYYNKKNERKLRIGNSYYLPEKTAIKGKLNTMVRKRGIFEVVLYDTELNFSGDLFYPQDMFARKADRTLLWQEAYFLVNIPDTRGLSENIEFRLGKQSIPFQPGPKSLNLFTSGIHVPLQNARSLVNRRTPFSFKLQLRGSENIRFAPIAKDNVVELQSDWPDPSFEGNFLPQEHNIDQKGFKANWKISYFGRNYPQYWTDANRGIANYIYQSAFGVKLYLAVDHYQKSMRAIKYGELFIFLTFLTVFLMEIIYRINIHPVQYLLVGFAMSVFYLLLIALSEHSFFYLSYFAAAVAIILLLTWYAAMIFRHRYRGIIAGFSVMLLYLYLYILLINQDYSLLIGSIGVFVILFLVMFITRKVDWYQLGWNNAEKRDS